MASFHAVLGLLLLADFSLGESYNSKTVPDWVKQWDAYKAAESEQADAFRRAVIDKAQDAYEEHVARREQSVKEEKGIVQEEAPKYVPRAVEEFEEKTELGFFGKLAASIQEFFTSIGMMVAQFFRSIGESLTAMATGKQAATDIFLPDEGDRKAQTVEVRKEVNYPVPMEQSTSEQRAHSHGVADLPNDEAVKGDRKGGRWSDMIAAVTQGAIEAAKNKIIQVQDAHIEKDLKDLSEGAGQVASLNPLVGAGMAAQKGVSDVLEGRKDNYAPYSTSGHVNGIKPLAGDLSTLQTTAKVSLQQNPQRPASIHLRSRRED